MKDKKLANIINLTLEADTIKHGKKNTRVLKISDLKRIYKIINEIDPEDSFKLMINFNKKEYYLFQTTNKELETIEEEINSEYIMKLYKNFYSTEELSYNKKLLNKNKKLRQEIAPCKFKVNASYIEVDRGYCIVNIVENINEIKAVRDIIDKNDIWLTVNFNKLNQERMLDTIAKMEENNFEKVKIDRFIKKNIYDFKEKLRNEELIQCEFKMIHFDEHLDSLNDDNKKLINKFRYEGIDVFKVQERLNIINAFNSSIYPYKNLDVTQSLEKNDFIKVIGGIV